MRNFMCGVAFMSGAVLFGKSMYELGRLKAQKEEAVRWATLRKTVEKIIEEKAEES